MTATDCTPAPFLAILIQSAVGRRVVLLQPRPELVLGCEGAFIPRPPTVQWRADEHAPDHGPDGRAGAPGRRTCAASFAQSPTPTATAAQDDGTAADPPADASKEVKAVYTDYSRDGVIDVCDHTRAVLQATLDGIEADFDRDFPDFREASRRASSATTRAVATTMTRRPRPPRPRPPRRPPRPTRRSPPRPTTALLPARHRRRRLGHAARRRHPPPATDDGTGTPPEDGTLPPATDEGTVADAAPDPVRRARGRRDAHAGPDPAVVSRSSTDGLLVPGILVGIALLGALRSRSRRSPAARRARATRSARPPTAPRARGRTSRTGSGSAAERHAARLRRRAGPASADRAPRRARRPRAAPRPRARSGSAARRCNPARPCARRARPRRRGRRARSRPASSRSRRASSCQPPLGPGRERTRPARRSGASTRRTCSGLVPALPARNSELTSAGVLAAEQRQDVHRQRELGVGRRGHPPNRNRRCYGSIRIRIAYELRSSA